MSEVSEALTHDWEALVAGIPDDLEASAKEYGALQRHRGIKSAAALLRLILIYANVLSLLTTALWGVGLKLCQISRQALEKRVLGSTAWLEHLLAVLLRTLLQPPANGTGTLRRIVLRDASVISRPGSPGVEWRLHLSWDPFHLQPAQVTLTDAHTGESLDHAGLQANDLLLGDRLYGIWRIIQQALEALAYFIIRLTWSNLPLCTPEGQPLDLIAWLKQLPAEQETAERSVYIADDPEKRLMRLVVGRLPADKAATARKKVEATAHQEKRPANPNTWLAAGFCILLTNLPGSAWSSLDVLAFYRLRWQIEWCFRRWKRLCHLDALPAYPAKIAQPVLLAKLIMILLMQQRLGALPWAELWSKSEPAPVVSPLVAAIYTRVQEIICPPAVIDQLLEDPTPFWRYLRSSHRRPPLQLAEVVRRFEEQLRGVLPAPPAPEPASA